MDPKEVADQIRRILKRELAACEAALLDNDTDTAQAELASAMQKLKRVAADLD
jgi:hypothetical protein